MLECLLPPEAPPLQNSRTGGETNGNMGNEVGEEGTEGEQGLRGIAGAAKDGLGREAEVIGQLVGLVDELASQAVEVRGRQGMDVCAGFEGVEVPRRRAAAARAKLRVTMGPAVGVAAHGGRVKHGLGAAAGCLTAGTVRVSGHVSNLHLHCSTNVLV